MGGQQYSRLGHSDIYHDRETERVCFEEAASTTVRVVASMTEAKTKVFIPREELQDIVL